MGGPAIDARGVGNRGTDNRRAAVPPAPVVPELPPPADYPPFNLTVLGLGGQREIPLALAYALKWHLELMRARDVVTAKELADNLIALHEWFTRMELESPRADDGALLVNDPLAQMSPLSSTVKFVELSTGETIPVETNRVEAPMPVWQPLLFPPELPHEIRANYPARPRTVDEIPPFFPRVLEKWFIASVRGEMPPPPPAPPVLEPGETGKIVESFEVFEPPSEVKEQEDAAERASQLAARKFDRERWTVERLDAFKGITPTVNAAIARLKSTTLNDITAHTGVKFDQAHADMPLIRNTEFILYHSVVSFVLDTNGEPFDLRRSREGRGKIDYPILIEHPGEQMKRSLPADDGVYVSVQKYGFGKFRLNDKGITKLLFGTVGGFTEYGYGYSGPHRIHKALQEYLDFGGSYGFVAAVTAPAVYAREEITWSRINDRIPEFADVVVPYLVREIGKRASYKLENWEEFATEVLVEVIKGIILDRVKTKVRNYIIKKIGKRIVPGLNAVAALVDLFTGDEEAMRVRNIIACIIVSLRSKAEEDLHIAGKTCAMVIADEFEDAVMDALIEHSKKGVARLSKRSKSQRDADEKAQRAKPAPKEATPPEKQPEAVVQKADAAAPAAEPPKTPVASKLPADQKVAQPADVARKGPPASLGDGAPQSTGAGGARASGDGAGSGGSGNGASGGSGSTSGGGDGNSGSRGKPKKPRAHPLKPSAPVVDPQDGKVTVKPKPPSPYEEELLRKARERQEKHRETVKRRAARQEQEEIEKAKRKAAREAEKERKKQQAAGNGGAGTGDSGSDDTQTSPASKGTGNKGTEAPATGAEGTGTVGAGAAGAGSDSAAPARRPARPPRRGTARPGDFKPLSPDDDGKIHVKEPAVPEDSHAVQGEGHIRTGSTNDEALGRANSEKERGLMGVDQQAHHGGQKRGGGETGEAMREAVRTSGESVNTAGNIVPAKSTSEDPRATHESSRPHDQLHKEKDQESLRRRVETAKSDDAAVRDAMRANTETIYDGGDPALDDFYLGGDPSEDDD